MLKTITLFDKSLFSKNDGSKSAFNKNNNNKLVFKKNNNGNKIDRCGVSGNSVEYAKKLRKLFKSKISKSKKMFRFWNLAKLGKNLLKSENSTNFGNMEARPKFLIPNAIITFYCLWLAFIKSLIFWDFDLKYHI